MLVHSAKPRTLSEIIENPDGFSDVYKNKPGHLLFSTKNNICLKQYNRYLSHLQKHLLTIINSFMNKYKTRELNVEDQNTSLLCPTQSRTKWRLLVSYVFLGNCFVEKELKFKEFTRIGQARVLNLLR